MGFENGVEARPSVALWPDRQGRGWRWERESAPGLDPGDDWLLLDRNGRLAVHLNRQSSGWRVVHPRIALDISEPDLDAAKARAQTVALASLPVHSKTRRTTAVINQLPSGAHLLSLQDMAPEQCKSAPAEVVDVARFAAPCNLLGGDEYPDAPELDTGTRRAIHDLEIDPSRVVEAPGLDPGVTSGSFRSIRYGFGHVFFLERRQDLH
jgi:hypothetical protein